MNIRLRTKKLIWAGVLGAAITLILASVGGYFFYMKSQERELALSVKYREELALLNETVEQNEVGYALNQVVDQGQQITENMLVKVSLPQAATSDDTLTLIDLNTINYFAKTELQPNTVLVGSMVHEQEALGNDVREGEYAFIDLPTKLSNEDHVDIRIQFPNGDDFILLSKKKVIDTLGVTVWMNMDEGDQLTMSSAIVDAFVEEAKIYAMPYVDGPMQLPSQVTYPVKTNVLELIKNSPNIVNIAKLNLEKQNRLRLENGLDDMSSELRHKLRTGEAAVESERKHDVKEREINAMNQFNQTPTEQEIIGEQSEGEDK